MVADLLIILTNVFGPGYEHRKTLYSKACLSGHSEIDKTKILMENGSLMKVKSIAECSHWSILQYF